MKECGYTQKEAQRLISKGRVFQNGQNITKTGAMIEGDFELVEFEPISKGLEPTYETKHFVVFDKPSGILIHPQNRHTPYSLVDELRFQFGKEANITHRIDQETSGLVLCAKNKQAEIDIKNLFETRQIKKTYLALVRGKLDKELEINAPLLRQKHQDTNVRTIVVVDEKGKPSQTFVKPLKYFSDIDATLVEASPHTGRQHQIRVHLFHVKHPIIGDPLYGQSFENMMRYFDRDISDEERLENTNAPRLLLHANSLHFDLYEEHYDIYSKENFTQTALRLVKM